MLSWKRLSLPSGAQVQERGQRGDRGSRGFGHESVCSDRMGKGLQGLPGVTSGQDLGGFQMRKWGRGTGLPDNEPRGYGNPKGGSNVRTVKGFMGSHKGLHDQRALSWHGRHHQPQRLAPLFPWARWQTEHPHVEEPLTSVARPHG